MKLSELLLSTLIFSSVACSEQKLPEKNHATHVKPAKLEKPKSSCQSDTTNLPSNSSGIDYCPACGKG